MFRRNFVFILIAIYFLFSFPYLNHQWDMMVVLHCFSRPVFTYFLSAWFLIIYFLYQRAYKRNSTISNTFFWMHVIITIIPTFFINYPFVTMFILNVNSPVDFLNGCARIGIAFAFYLLTQLVFFVFLLLRLKK